MNENNKLKPFDVLLPLAFVLIMWVVELIEVTQDLDFGKYGIKPRSVENFIGIFTTIQFLCSFLVLLFFTFLEK